MSFIILKYFPSLIDLWLYQTSYTVVAYLQKNEYL